MKIGIVQPLVGQIGGNDMVLDGMIEALKDHDLTLFTFTKPLKKYSIPVKSKIPVRLPALGIYQKLFMPSHNYDEMDLIISNNLQVKTTKPLIVYDQNQMANDFTNQLSSKYNHGFWKFYATPYRFARRFVKHDQDAYYCSISVYSATKLNQAIGVKVDVLYPPVNLGGTHTKKKLNQICVIGRIAPEKNLEQTVEILNKVNCPCVIAGSVTKVHEPYLRKLKELAKGHIFFEINIPRIQLLDIFAESKIYFTASQETFGIATVEAIASGCIPIVPDNSAHPEIVDRSCLRYLSNDNAKIMIDTAFDLDYNLILKELHNRIGLFSYERFKDNLDIIIDEVMN